MSDSVSATNASSRSKSLAALGLMQKPQLQELLKFAGEKNTTGSKKILLAKCEDKLLYGFKDFEDKIWDVADKNRKLKKTTDRNVEILAAEPNHVTITTKCEESVGKSYCGINTNLTLTQIDPTPPVSSGSDNQVVARGYSASLPESFKKDHCVEEDNDDDCKVICEIPKKKPKIELPAEGGNSLLVQGGVKFQPMPFHDIIKTIAGPLELHADQPTCSFKNICFHLQLQDIHAIHLTRCFSVLPNGTRVEKYLTQVYIRFGVLSGPNDDKEEYDSFPTNLALSVNGRLVALSSARNRPVEITKYLNLKTSWNILVITWNGVDNKTKNPLKTHAVSIFMCRALSVKDVALKVAMKLPWPVQDSLTKIRRILSQVSGEGEVYATAGDITIPTTCPITQIRMKIPAKSVNCEHVACFDLVPFLEMHYGHLKMSCPICKVPVKVEDLRIDKLCRLILKTIKDSDVKEVHITENGWWYDSGRKTLKHYFYGDGDVIELVE